MLRFLLYIFIVLTAIVPVNFLLNTYNVHGIFIGLYNTIMIILTLYLFVALIPKEKNGEST